MAQQAFELVHHGMTIRGSIYRPDGQGRHPTVLFLHGFTGNRIEAGFLFVQLARALVQRGIAAVTFDFRNSGESDGSFDQMLVTGELDDALRMTEWLQGQSFVDRSRMGLLGCSLGGLLAACTCGRVNVYRALVLLAPTTEQNMCRHVSQRDEGGYVNIGPHTIRPDLFDDVVTLDGVADVVKHPRPTLLVQGGADIVVPPRISQRFVDTMRQAGVPVTHEVIEGGDHVFYTPAVRRRLLHGVVDWLAGQLNPR